MSRTSRWSRIGTGSPAASRRTSSSSPPPSSIPWKAPTPTSANSPAPRRTPPNPEAPFFRSNAEHAEVWRVDHLASPAVGELLRRSGLGRAQPKKDFLSLRYRLGVLGVLGVLGG